MYDELLASTVLDGVEVLQHRGRLVILDPTGDVLLSRGDADAPVFARSVLKPFRSVANARDKVFSQHAFSAEEVAISSGSHSGTLQHTRDVERILARVGLDRKALRCGVRAPLGSDALEEVYDGLLAVSELIASRRVVGFQA